MTNALLVVAKHPVPGQTKTRLCPPLTPIVAAELYGCFLSDTVDSMRKVPDVRCMIGFLPEDAQQYFLQLAPDMALLCQRGASLGERLDNLLTETLAMGVRRAVVMNSDSPTLPVAYIVQAFEQLEATDIVLGPSRDGGYYLMGTKQPQPHLLRDVQMSTPHVLEDTLALAEASGLTVSLLPPWYDVDTIADLHQLSGEIARMGTNGNVTATSRYLAQMGWPGLSS